MQNKNQNFSIVLAAKSTVVIRVIIAQRNCISI